MARPNHSASFRNSQGQTIVITPADMGVGDKSEAEQIAAANAFKADLKASKDGDGKASERIAATIDAAKERLNAPKAPTVGELKQGILDAFEETNITDLKNNSQFKLATAGRKINFSSKESMLPLYREWVKVPMNERNEKGATAINGIDVLKNFRPWHVFQLDPKTATVQDIKKTYRNLAKTHHPDAGGDRRVFEQLGKMRDSLLFGRK